MVIILLNLKKYSSINNAIDPLEDTCNGRTFLLDYSHSGRLRSVKQQIIDMVVNDSKVRDTARVLHLSPNTVTRELKKGIFSYSK